MIMLATWIPFVIPMNWMQGVWYLLLIPLAFGISVIYKAIRVHDLATFWAQVWTMTLQIVLVIAALAILLVLFVRLVLPAI